MRPTPWPLLLTIAALGLVLRIASARGGLWLDEAWSAVFARDVGTPLGVIFAINHDNNHPLNTLWLLLVGFEADPVVQRGLSIASGTATIIVAGLIGFRRSVTTGVITALLFAVSPVLVTYGSEARGYAPMLLALVMAVAIADRWLVARGPAPAALVAVAVAGMLAQLTFIFGLVAIGGWIVLSGRWRAGIAAGVRVMTLPMIAAVLVALLIVGIPVARGAFTFGNLEAFDHARQIASLGDLIGYTFGVPSHPGLVWIVAAATLATLAFVKARAPFYALAILGLPVAMAILQPANGAIARYYLPSAIALLLLGGEVAGLAWQRAGWARGVMLVALAAFLTGSAWRDAALVANLRADPSRPIVAMGPGATVAVEMERSTAILEAAAASRGTPITFAPCPRFLFVERDGDAPFPAAPTLCGTAYRPIAEGHPTGLSGTHWTLYEAAR